MGSYEKISRSKSWSFLNWVYKHIRTDKLVCTHTQYGLLKIGVTTHACRKNAPYIYCNSLSSIENALNELHTNHTLNTF
jgi:hypothetical protein